MPIPRGKSATVIAAVAALMSAVSTSALAQSQDATRSLANGDSLLIDGRTFSITPGKAKGDVSAEIAKLDAHEVGPGAIVFRSGDRLYIVDSAPPAQNATLMYDPAIERQRALGLRAELDYERQRPLGLRDRQLDYERERPLGLRDSQLDYERQRPLGLREADIGRQQVYINDPDYAYYRLKRTFEEIWGSDKR